MTLALSIAALLLGPLIYAAGRNNKLARRLFDILIVVTIAVIIVLHIIPEALQAGGNWAIALLGLGIVFPLLLERVFRRAANAAHQFIVAVAALGLLVHVIVDGVALSPDSGAGLAYAIILHRPAVGMAIWWTVRPTFGKTVAVLTLAIIALATAAGYFVGETVLQMAGSQTLALLQAFVSGSLLHVVLFGAGQHNH